MSGSAYPLGPGATPQWLAGYVPSAAEWNMWWSNKVDADNPELVGGPFLALSGGTMTGELVLAGPPLHANDAVTKAYADSLTGAAGPFLPMAGGTMTGVLTLAAAYPPVGPNDAVPKQYADQIQASASNAQTTANAAQTTANAAVPRSGAVMTGYLTLAGDPMSPLMAATKQYVDNNFLSLAGGTLSGALTVGSTGVQYGPYSGSHHFAFGWDGSFLLEYVDGSYIGQLATLQYIDPKFAPYYWVQTNYYNASTSDSRYLYKSGDTCNGTLSVNGGFGAQTIYSGGDANIQGGVWIGADNNFGLYQDGSDNRSIAFNQGNGWVLQWNHTDGGLRYYNPSNVAVLTSFGQLGDFAISGSNAYKAGGGPWAALSDPRSKTITGDYTHGLAALRQLRPKRFHYNQDSGQEFVGLDAQEAETVWPSLVFRGEGEIDGEPVADLRYLDPNELTYALINAVITLADRLDRLTGTAAKA